MIQRSEIISLISLAVSILTLLFYLFREYKEFITLYFSDTDLILVPNVQAAKLSAADLINEIETKYHRHINIFKYKSMIYNPQKIYYCARIEDYYPNLSDEFSILFSDDELSKHYFQRVLLTHKGRKKLKPKDKQSEMPIETMIIKMHMFSMFAAIALLLFSSGLYIAKNNSFYAGIIVCAFSISVGVIAIKTLTINEESRLFQIAPILVSLLNVVLAYLALNK